jgi:hypothetical protein
MKQTEDGKRWQKRFLVASGPRVFYFGRPGEPLAKARDVSACEGVRGACC